jgi:hypothetical protein
VVLPFDAAVSDDPPPPPHALKAASKMRESDF